MLGSIFSRGSDAATNSSSAGELAPAQQPVPHPSATPDRAADAAPLPTHAGALPLRRRPQLPTTGALHRLTVQDAEALAIKNNPQISVYRLLYLASNQVTREAESRFLPDRIGGPDRR